jgi:hypothetical protein
MLSIETLYAHRWRLGRNDGSLLAPLFRFLPDGLTSGYNNPFEARWSLQDGLLSLRTADGLETTRFTEVTLNADGQPHLSGPFLLLPDSGITHSLEPASHNHETSSGNLHVAVTLGSSREILFVSFNSLKRPFQGSATRWEFFQIPLKLGIDHLRFAECVAPDMWYLDKTSQIQAILNGVLARGYRLVVMCGLSSGGYASLLFSELLCQRYPRTLFRSFTINPQTSHSAGTKEFMRALPQGFAPALIDDDALARRDIAETEIAAIGACSQFRENIRHNVFYDSGNQAEEYYVQKLVGLPGIDLQPIQMAVGHLSGCIALFERGVVHDAMEATCSAF